MNWLKSWLPAWALVIATASTDAFSAEHTSRIILPFLHWLLPHAPVATLELLHFVIRKCAHFAECFVFSLLLLRAVPPKTPRLDASLGACRTSDCSCIFGAR
jgi:hypothetical protein